MANKIILSISYSIAKNPFVCINNRFLRERGMASNLKMGYHFLFCIFQKNLAMATLGLKEMGKFLWEGREKGGKSRKKGRARIKK